MLRITTEKTSSTVRLRLEGKLGGAWVAELDKLCFDRKPAENNKSLVLDLKGLTGIDTAGRYLLILLHKQGVPLENISPLLCPLVCGSAQNEKVAE